MQKSIEDILNYPVPIITDEGDCTESEGMGCFNVEQFLPFVLDDQKADILQQMDDFMDEFIHMERVDWCGVYMRIEPQAYNELYTPALLKLVYRGEMSRGLFPLTEEFAKQSNNSTVALTGKAIQVDNVEDYRAAGGCYYECDPRVQSEYCAPFFDQMGKVIGIIDVESFSQGSFSDPQFKGTFQSSLEKLELLLQAFVK